MVFLGTPELLFSKESVAKDDRLGIECRVNGFPEPTVELYLKVGENMGSLVQSSKIYNKDNNKVKMWW